MASSIRERARNVLQAVFAADAAGLGLHWNYDQSQTNVPNPEYNFSVASQWHPNKKSGELTHYGDVALVLAQALTTSSLDKAAYYSSFKARFFNPAQEYNDYIEDGFMVSAGKNTPAGPSAEDVEGSAFIASPFAAVRYANLSDEEFKAKTIELITLTHSNELPVQAALGSAIAIRFALKNADAGVAAAIQAGAAASSTFAELLQAALKPAAATADSISFAAENGLACSIPMVVPVAAQAALTSSSFAEFTRKSIQSGGNSSARVFALGSVVAANSAAPAELFAPVKAKAEITVAIEGILDAAGL